MNKKEHSLEVLRKILDALHDKRFPDISEIVTNTKTGPMEELPDFLLEFVQGTAEANDFQNIDKFDELSDIYFDEFNDIYSIEYILTADGGEELPLLLRLELKDAENGETNVTLDIQPN